MNNLIGKINAKAKAKIINGKTLNSSMFLGLALEYVDSLNNETTPTITTALDRVVYAESNKIMNKLFEDLRVEVDNRANRNRFPIDKEDLEEILDRVKFEFTERIHLQLSPILDVDEIIRSQNGFLEKFKYIAAEKSEENYKDSFMYNFGLLKNLMKCVPFEQLLDMDPNNSDEAKVPSIMIKEFSNAMFNVIEEYLKNCKGPAKHDTLAEFIIESNFVNDNEKIDFKNEKKYFSYILAFTQNLKDVYFAAEIEKARIKQNETQSKDRKLQEQKANLEKKLEIIQKEIEKFKLAKSELDLKLDQYERQKHNIDAEFESDLRLKEMELEYKNKALEAELEETESLLISLKEERTKLKKTNEDIKEQINDIEKETLVEVAALDSELGKIDNDLQDVRQKVKDKQNNPKVEHMQKFFNEIKDFIATFKEELGKQDNLKTLKVAFFNMQRKLNDKEFENSQEELKVKKKLNEEMKIFKISQEEELQILEEELGKVPSSETLMVVKNKVKEMEAEIEELERNNQRLQKRKIDRMSEIESK